MRSRRPGVLTLALAAAGTLTAQTAPVAKVIHPETFPKVGTISDRFQSYNIEMVEVTGGRFWKPYDEVDTVRAKQKDEGTNTPSGIDPALFQYRPPINLANTKLRKMAAGLAPAYVRVSGTWQNTTYFQDSDASTPNKPPAGFNGVLTRAQWKGVIDFAYATGSQIVTSVAGSAGTRDSNGLWTTAQAQQLFDFTHRAGGEIAATEFINEPSFPNAAGVPKGYDGAAFGRDIAVFAPFLRKVSPKTILLGPGSVGEGITIGPGDGMVTLSSADMLKATGPVFDALSHHFYGTVSSRCSALAAGTTADAALTSEWLTRTDLVKAFYDKLNAQYGNKPMWLTETGQTACGGDRWASTFLDTFRYLHQLGTLAKNGVQVVAHNTLAASDYALLDPKTLDPRPNYWAALLWRRTMGTTVLDAGPSPSPNLYLYAQCLRGSKGGVALLAINASTIDLPVLTVPAGTKQLALTADTLQARMVLLNGKPLTLAADGTLPGTPGQAISAGPLTLAAASSTFLEMGGAANPSCSQ